MTRAVATSIQAVSPLSIGGASPSAASARLGIAAARNSPARVPTVDRRRISSSTRLWVRGEATSGQRSGSRPCAAAEAVRFGGGRDAERVRGTRVRPGSERYPVASDPLSGNRRTDMRRALGVLLIAAVLAACGDSGGGGGGGDGAAGLVGGPGTTQEQAVPPIAAVWFGTAYDAATMYIYDRASTFKQGSPLVAVATLITPRDPSDLKITVEINGSVKATLPPSAGGTGTTYGVDLSPQKFAPGGYLISFKSQAGKSLASASVTISK